MKSIQRKSDTFLSFDDTQIYYEDRGEGVPILFVYGIGCLINHWNPQIKYFSQTHRTIAYDFRAHNLSEAPKDPTNYDIEAFAKDMYCLLNHLKIKKVHVVAHSFGAQVVTKAFDMYPDMFFSITFVNGFVSNPVKGMFGSQVPTKIFEALKTGLGYAPNAAGAIWKYAISNPLSVPLAALAGGFNLSLTNYKDIEIYSKALSHMELRWFLNLFEHMMNYDGTDVLDKMQLPVLIIGGNKDAVTPAQHQKLMHHRLPNSQLTIMPYGSHCTQLDLSEYVNLRIEKFLSEQ